MSVQRRTAPQRGLEEPRSSRCPREAWPHPGWRRRPGLDEVVHAPASHPGLGRAPERAREHIQRTGLVQVVLAHERNQRRGRGRDGGVVDIREARPREVEHRHRGFGRSDRAAAVLRPVIDDNHARRRVGRPTNRRERFREKALLAADLQKLRDFETETRRS